MSRTTVEVTMRTNHYSEVIQIIEQKACPAGYQLTGTDGKWVWSKGDGAVVMKRCIGAEFTGRSVIIQGWVEDMLAGDSDLEGFVGIFPKKKLKKLMAEICDTIVLRQL